MGHGDVDGSRTLWQHFQGFYNTCYHPNDGPLLDLATRFSFGINLDDPWRYSGATPPRSIIIPHLLSVSLPEGKILDEADDRDIRARGESEPTTVAGRAILSLGDSLVESKVDFVRCWFPWKYFEPEPTAESSLNDLLERSYSNWPMDELVNGLTSRGIGVVPVLACGYHRMLPQGLEPDSNRALYIRRAAVHARLLTRHYKDRVRGWQIENEPNWWAEHEAGGWRSGLSWVEDHEFKHGLLEGLNQAVHDEDPKACTIINLEADAKSLAPTQYSSSCDILGLDFYPNYKRASPVDPGVTKLADQIGKALEKPLVISETGYPSGPSVLGYSLDHQADYVEKVSRGAFAFQNVTGIGIWRYIDTAWRSFPPQENHFGLFDNRGTPKPAWSAYQRVIRELK